MRDDLLIGLALVFIPFSLTSIGGGGAIIAGIQNETVNVHAWISASDFIHLFAVSRAAPGPGMMLATVIGWKVAGWLGALVASLGAFPAVVAALLHGVPLDEHASAEEVASRHARGIGARRRRPDHCRRDLAVPRGRWWRARAW